MKLTWSDTLYRLHGRFGGVFLGEVNKPDDHAVLHLEHRGVPLTLEDRYYYNGWTRSTRYLVLAPCELEQPYRLTLRHRGYLEHGLDLVKPDRLLAPWPELKKEYRADTSHPEFTATVLRQASFRAALLAAPACLVRVRPCVEGQPGLHLLEVQASWSELKQAGPDPGGPEGELSFEQVRQQRAEFLEQCARSLEEQMVRLMDLAAEARAAVTAYRML